MRLPPLLRSFLYIAFFLSAVRAFNVTVGAPTQCDDLAVSWTGGQAPFEIVLVPVYETLHNYSVPDSAFSNGKGSFSVPQIPLKSGTPFMLIMSDATGFGSGGTTTVLTVGAPVANNNCNTTVVSPDFTFELPTSLQQCNGYLFDAYDGAIQPITITALIPGGDFTVLYPPNGTSYNWVVDVEEGTDLVFFMMDSQGRSGGISDIEQVSLSADTSCLNVNSPSSTASAPAQTSSQSTPSGTTSNTTNVGIIAGASVGGAVLLALVIMLGLCYKRKASSSSAVVSSPTRRKCYENDVEEDGHIPQDYPFQYQADHANRVFLPIQPGSQSRPANASAIDPFTQHLRQISYSDTFPGSLYPNRRMTTMGGHTPSPSTLSYQTLPVGLAPPVHPGTHVHLPNVPVGNFAANDPHAPFSPIQPSRGSSNIDGLSGHGDSASSAMSLASRQVATRAGQTPPPNYPFQYETHPVGLTVPLIQAGDLSRNTSAGTFAISGPPSPLHQMQPSHLSSNTDAIPGSGATQMSSNSPTQIIVHTDIEDVPTTPNSQGVVELPPQYADRQSPAAAQPPPEPRRKSSRVFRDTFGQMPTRS